MRRHKGFAFILILTLVLVAGIGYIAASVGFVEMTDGSMEPAIPGLKNNTPGTGSLVLITKHFSIKCLRSNDLVLVRHRPTIPPTIRRIRYAPGDTMPPTLVRDSHIVPKGMFWLTADGGNWIDSNLNGFYEAEQIEAKVLRVWRGEN